MAVNLQDRLNRWEVLNANIKQHLENMPNMKPTQAEFEQVIAQDLALAAQYNQLLGTGRKVILDRRVLAKKGNQLRKDLVPLCQEFQRGWGVSGRPVPLRLCGP